MYTKPIKLSAADAFAKQTIESLTTIQTANLVEVQPNPYHEPKLSTFSLRKKRLPLYTTAR